MRRSCWCPLLAILIIVYVWTIDDEDLDYYDPVIEILEQRSTHILAIWHFNPRGTPDQCSPDQLTIRSMHPKMDGIHPKRNVYLPHDFAADVEDVDTTDVSPHNTTNFPDADVLLNTTGSPATPEPEVLRPPEVEHWQTVDEYRTYVFSAHRDPRHPARTIVYVFGIMLTRLLRERSDIRLYCHLVTEEFGIIDTVLGNIRTMGLRQYK